MKAHLLVVLLAPATRLDQNKSGAISNLALFESFCGRVPSEVDERRSWSGRR